MNILPKHCRHPAARRQGLAGVALLLALPFNAPAFTGDWELDYDTIANTGQQLLDNLAPPSIRENYRFYTADELRDTFAPIQDALAQESLAGLSALRDQTSQTLANLRADPNSQPYADWLAARMDFFDMAAEVEQALPAPAPPPSPRPPAPPPTKPLPPHPTTPPPPRPLPPHPATPAPSPPLIPHPVTPAPAPSPPPDKRLEQARNRYVESRDVWVRKLSSRPPPERATALLPSLKQIFREEGIPPQLVWQAEAESTFNPAARSPAGAVGLFQFMPATAKEYGLNLTPADDRLDAQKSARAAARYLKYLHNRFGSWPLALAAYNCGQGRVAKTLRETNGKTFDDIHDRLPAETRMYVPKIAALIQLRENANLDLL